MKMEKKVYKYIAGICFALLALSYLNSSLHYSFSIWGLLQNLGIIIITIIIFAPKFKKNRILLEIGVGLALVVQIYNFIGVIYIFKTYQYDYDYDYAIISLICSIVGNIINIIYWLLFLVGNWVKRDLKIFFLTAGIAEAICFGMDIAVICSGTSLQNFNLSTLNSLFKSVGAIMLSLSLEKEQAIVRIEKQQTPRKSAEDIIKSLVELKELLGNGIITKEEFEDKKRRLFSESNELMEKKQEKNNESLYINQLRELKSLFDDGVLTEEEFTNEKKKILSK